MTNAAEVSDSRYKLEIAYDTDPPNPREWYNLGTMVCWHRRYTLGDDHTYSDMSDLFRSLIRDSDMTDEKLISYVKSGKAEDLRLVYDKSERSWGLEYYNDYFNKWYMAGQYDAPLATERGIVAEDILENLRTGDLLELAESAYIIKPLFLYDHGVQSISTNSFSGRAHHADWDSGQVGVVYADFDTVKKNYGSITPENIEKANRLINTEVEDYDRYIRGESYGFRLYQDGDEIESCWGFLESFDDALKSISEYLPQEAKYLAQNAEYGTCKVAEPQKDLLGRISKNQNKVDADKETKQFTQSQERKKSSEFIE